MTPVNNIALVLILGLELMLIGHEEESKNVELIGTILMIIGWILNTVAIFVK